MLSFHYNLVEFCLTDHSAAEMETYLKTDSPLCCVESGHLWSSPNLLTVTTVPPDGAATSTSLLLEKVGLELVLECG